VDESVGTQPGSSVGNQEGTWVAVSVEDAARALGISTNTVRRQVKAGTLRSERISRPQGYVVRVYIPEGQVPNGQVPEVPSEVPTQVTTLVPVQERIEAIETLARALMAPLREELADARTQLAELATENGRLKERLAALEAPREDRKTSQHQTFFDQQAQPPKLAIEPTEQPAPPPDPAPRRWWQRLLFG
jgi:hypothetical protein